MTKHRRDDTCDLLQRWHAGDKEALGTLLAENREWMYRKVGRFLRPAHEHDIGKSDIVAEAMVAALQYKPRFVAANRGQFRALLARIILNRIRDAQRKPRPPKQPIPSDSVLNLDPSIEGPTGPLSAAHRNERKNWILLAIEFLDPDQRWLVQQRVFRERSFPDLARELQTSPDAIDRRYRRILSGPLTRTLLRLKSGAVEALAREREQRDRGVADDGD